ncbi:MULTISPECIES: hypothetical protein [Actinosynnema]|uniref:hypothetical protein n=1 Tax=Actinosynnema TaxID=40566 RepID=UPI0020A2AB79|nr:hypothetical protein [Actinosynnema pretiosum]MCP2092863.1 hypothetical protein [Actinosynnema pretiosum]
MVVNSLRRILAVAALCASFGVVTAVAASASPSVNASAIEDTFTPPYSIEP